MNTVEKLKINDKSLGFTLILMLASGMQLEATAGSYAWSVWVHIVFGTLLTVLSIRHIYLHYRSSNWFARFAKNRNKVTRVLWWVFLLTAMSGIAATVQWIVENGHSPIGGVHGKIGFLMVIIAIIHAAKHIRLRKQARKSKSQNHKMH